PDEAPKACRVTGGTCTLGLATARTLSRARALSSRDTNPGGWAYGYEKPRNPARRPNRRRGRQAAGVTGASMPETMIGTAVERAEAKVRRLMAQRAAIPPTWETRARRAELYREILAALEGHAGCE